MPGWSRPSTTTGYNRNLSVAENLLFGTPVGKSFDGDNIAADPAVEAILRSTGLTDLQRMGLCRRDHGRATFSDLSPDNPLFEQYSFISADELAQPGCCCSGWAARVSRQCRNPMGGASSTLPFRYTRPAIASA